MRRAATIPLHRKSMQDHGLFQAICRTNGWTGGIKRSLYRRLQGLFKQVQGAMAVYTSELDHSDGRSKSRYPLAGSPRKKGRERLDEALEVALVTVRAGSAAQGRAGAYP